MSRNGAAFHLWIQSRTNAARIADSPMIQDLFHKVCGNIRKSPLDVLP